MNWIVIKPSEIIDQQNIQILNTDLRFQHIQNILKKQIGETVKVVVLNVGNFLFRICQFDNKVIVLEKETQLETELRTVPIHTFLSLPRPQTGKKILHLTACYGISEVTFQSTQTKNKEYWTSPVYGKEMDLHLESGYAQTGNICPVAVRLFKTGDWKKNLPMNGKQIYALDRSGESLQKEIKISQISTDEKPYFLFGPESGWLDNDLEFFRTMEIPILSLGKINLRTEFAYHALIHQCFINSETK
ncbi:16S rRNA (uracil(1498)-N(3))-methyltransferase [Leptospira sp. 96542]|nr:16S rRNA (uracil(1498)-N(3))-methyltransferase [Leptospira sp. 96542]